MKKNDKSITYNGNTYTPDGHGYYYNSNTRKRLHQAIWEYHYGEIPEGHQIHHIDHDKSNNDISNLACLSEEEHHAVHSAELTSEQREWLRNNLNEKARPEANKWHRSEAGKAWHRKHASEMYKRNVFRKEKVCQNCGKTFMSKTGHDKYCSNNCKSAYRRKTGVDNVERTCLYCGKPFIVNKYSKAVFCSHSCVNYGKDLYAIYKNKANSGS